MPRALLGMDAGPRGCIAGEVWQFPTLRLAVPSPACGVTRPQGRGSRCPPHMGTSVGAGQEAHHLDWGLQGVGCLRSPVYLTSRPQRVKERFGGPGSARWLSEFTASRCSCGAGMCPGTVPCLSPAVLCPPVALSVCSRGCLLSWSRQPQQLRVDFASSS